MYSTIPIPARGVYAYHIGSGDLYAGQLSRRALRLVQEWEELYRAELVVNWELARQAQPLVPIAPLTWTKDGGTDAQLIRVQSAEPLDAPCIRVVFSNGEQREIDLTPYIATGIMFEPVRTNHAFSQSVMVDGGIPTWPNGADIDPDVLYYGETPPWAQATPQAATTRS